MKANKIDIVNKYLSTSVSERVKIAKKVATLPRDYLVKNEKKEKQYWSMMPASLCEFHPLNAINIYLVEELSYLESMPVLLMKDGAIDALRFFTTHEPHEFNNIFIVNSEFSFFIPKEWEEKVVYFKPVIHAENQEKKNLLIESYLSMEFFTEEYLFQFLDENKERLANCMAYMPLRPEIYIDPYRVEQTHMSIRIVQEMYRRYNKSIDFVTMEHILSLDNLSDFNLKYLNQGLINVSHDHVVEKLLSRGIDPLNILALEQKPDILVEASPYHSMALFSSVEDVADPKEMDLVDHMKKIMRKKGIDAPFNYFLIEFFQERIEQKFYSLGF